MEEIIKRINSLDFISFEESFNLANKCSRLLRNTKDEEIGRKIIIHVLDNWNKIDSATKDIWTDLIEAAGFYPYLEKYKEELKLDNTAAKIRREFHKSNNLLGKYLHEEQRVLLDIINSSKNVIVSAPTSFGKSLLIEEIVASYKYRNIVIIQPTLALLDETRLKLKKYADNYKIIIKTSQAPSETKRNLFLLTAERVMEYLDLPKIDLLILDEFYKLSSKRDDERSDTLNNAFNLLVNKHKSKFYLLGPNIDGISKGFSDKYNAEFFKTSYSLVDSEIVDYYSRYKGKFGERGEKKKFKEQKLFELLYELKEEQSIIYCSSPYRARYLAGEFQKYLQDKNVTSLNKGLPILEWIEENISHDWSLIDCLEYKIGIHDGALQKHITSSIIRYFNEQKLNYLFCTSTIIEGVNTSAKNVMYFDATKGNRKKIDYFDYSNIKGRAGRMMVHLTGKVYNFNAQPEKENVIIDIPFFEQNPVSDEILIHIEEKDVIDKESTQYRTLMDIPPEEREIYKRNGALIKGQQAILTILEKEIEAKYNFINWNEFPKYPQLYYILSLAWDHLLKPGETTRPMTKERLTKVTFDYGINQDISYLVKNNFLYYKKLAKYRNKEDKLILDEAIRDAFQTLKHWFQYKVPKWLNVINSLQIYICEKKELEPGNYTLYASKIESDFIRNNLSILAEYGIPRSAIEKISSKIPSNISEEDVIKLINKKDVISDSNLIQYEKDKFYESIYWD